MLLKHCLFSSLKKYLYIYIYSISISLSLYIYLFLSIYFSINIKYLHFWNLWLITINSEIMQLIAVKYFTWLTALQKHTNVQ